MRRARFEPIFQFVFLNLTFYYSIAKLCGVSETKQPYHQRRRKMRFLSQFPWFRREASLLDVDYAKGPLLPNGAAKILRHMPVGDKILTISPGSLELQEMPRGTTYAEYYKMHSAEGLCDVQILDALVEVITRNPPSIKKFIREFFGEFAGQIFFLGTSFASEDGRECVPFLNLNTHFPALRYICPATHPINHDVCCCACFFRPGRQKQLSLQS